MKGVLHVCKQAVFNFIEHGCPSLAAALAYYTTFSLAPLLLIVIGITGPVFGKEAVQARIYEQVASLIGVTAANQVVEILAAIQSSSQGSAAALLGFVLLAFSATSAFAQLQSALNAIWEVKPDPNQNEIRNFFIKRLVSFGMVLGIAFLLMVSLLLSAVLAAFADTLNRLLPAGLSAPLLQALTSLVGFFVSVTLFGAIYRVLPDAHIRWSDVTFGAVVTALLFTGGKLAIGFYVGNSNVTTVYGAAASLAIILLWTYYTSMILLFGAELTHSLAQYHGKRVQPEQGAIRVKQQEVRA
jgi:membrane protein